MNSQFVVDFPATDTEIKLAVPRKIGDRYVPNNSPFGGDGSGVITKMQPNDYVLCQGAAKSSGDSIECNVAITVAREGYYAFDDYGYPFHILGIVNIDREKALIAVNPGQGYFIYRARYEKGIMPQTCLLPLSEAVKTSFGEQGQWLNISRYHYPVR